MLVKREPLRVKPDPLVHLQGRHPLGNILVNGKRQMEKIIHLPFVVEIDLCDLHGLCRGGSRSAPTGLHGFRAFSHFIAQVVRVFVNGEECAEIEEEAQTP